MVLICAYIKNYDIVAEKKKKKKKKQALIKGLLAFLHCTILCAAAHSAVSLWLSPMISWRC